jgi:hypothetical protein
MADPKTTNATTDPKAVFNSAADSTVKVVEDVMAKAQQQYLTAVTETQNIALDAYKTMVDTVGKLNLPAVPGLAGLYQVPANLIEGAFDFGAAVLENQRTFAKKVLEAASN